jgi:hypothetical protein
VGDVGDVHLEEPAAVLAALDVNGIVEIAGRFAVNRDDGKLAKILASGAVGIADGASNLFGVVDDFGRKGVRQVVLADDDFGVDAEIAGTAEDFGDASGGGHAPTAIAGNFGIDDGSIELGDVGEAFASSGLLLRGGKELFAESAGKFVSGGEFDFVLNARVVWCYNAAAGRIAEKTHDGGMRAADDADDASFGASRTGKAAEASDPGNHGVSVHRVFDVIARNEEIAIDVRKGNVRDHEAIAVVMQDEAAADLVARGRFVLRNFFGCFGGGGT